MHLFIVVTVEDKQLNVRPVARVNQHQRHQMRTAWQQSSKPDLFLLLQQNIRNKQMQFNSDWQQHETSNSQLSKN